MAAATDGWEAEDAKPIAPRVSHGSTGSHAASGPMSLGRSSSRGSQGSAGSHGSTHNSHGTPPSPARAAGTTRRTMRTPGGTRATAGSPGRPRPTHRSQRAQHPRRAVGGSRVWVPKDRAAARHACAPRGTYAAGSSAAACSRSSSWAPRRTGTSPTAATGSTPST